MAMKKNWLLVFVLLINVLEVNSQVDTVSLTLEQSEKLFADSNLLLLAGRFDIDAQKALVMQARIWDLPEINVTHQAYHTRTKKYFETGVNGETAVQIQQLLLIAGKRNRQVKMALAQQSITENQFYDLLRTLKLQLRSSFYNVYFLRQMQPFYVKAIGMLDEMVKSYNELYDKGLVSLEQNVRLKTLLLSMESDQADLLKQISAEEGQLRELLKLNPGVTVVPMMPDTLYASFSPSMYNLRSLIDTAMNCRGDLLAEQQLQEYSRLNFSYQKSLAIPDVEVIGGWDKQGSYIPNYNYLGISFGLPLWNRNKGNIRSSQAQYEGEKARFSNMQLTVSNDVASAWEILQLAQQQYEAFDTRFIFDTGKILSGMNRNFVTRQIGLLEYVDFFQSMKDAQSQYFQLLNSRLQAIEGLNFAVGKDIIRK